MRQSVHLRRALLVGGCALIALVCAVSNYAHVSLLPPSVSKRQIDIAAATARIAVDFPVPLLRDSTADDGRYADLQARSVLIANLMSTDAVMVHIAKHAGVPVSSIAANTRVMTNVQPAMLEPDSERRTAQLADAARPYELEFRPDPSKPTITVYAQAPTVAEAQKLAEAARPGVQGFLADLARKQHAGPLRQARLVELGPARGAIVNGGTGIEIAGLTFVFSFAMALIAMVAALGLRARRAAPDPRPDAPERAPGTNGGGRVYLDGPARGVSGINLFRTAVAGPMPAGVMPYARPLVARPTTARRNELTARTLAARAGDWPRTTRILPWLIAAFMVVIWLVPFNEIQLTISLPVDLKFDRLVLPVLAGVWILVLAAGGPDGPRIRITPIHVAVGGVVVMACLSLVMSAHTLTRTLEFDGSAKKLTLLGSYVMMFVIVASVVRRSEVRAFMTFTLILAGVCAFGTVVEYRFNFNVFFWASGKFLPGLFSIGEVTPDGVDEIGRRLIRGPGQVSLETVAMLSMALPIALARLIHAGPKQRRWVYAVLIAILMAAMVSTFRKTALIAPLSVCLTIMYFRRRELLKLAPLGIVLILVIQALSPGALTGVAGQLDRSRLGVTTVSDRSADYDAIRPDVWSHLAFGRGYGSYIHTTYRILDMELLRQIIEVGVLGLIVYLAMPLTIIAVAKRPIRARGPDAPVALAVAAGAVSFIVVSTLFDVMSFPHVPYILLFMAAILAVITADDGCGRIPETQWRR